MTALILVSALQVRSIFMTTYNVVFIQHTMKRGDLFWLTVTEVSVHDGGGQGEVEELLA